ATSASVSPAAKPCCSSAATPAGSASAAADAPPERSAPPRAAAAATRAAAARPTMSLRFTGLRVGREGLPLRVVEAAERRGHVRERLQVGDVVRVDGVAERHAVPDQGAADDALGDVDHVV